MSSCSRCRQAHSTAKTNWNGDTFRSLLQTWSILGGTLRRRAVRAIAIDGLRAVQRPAEPNEIDVLALEEALTCLTALDAQQGRIVELRFFGGLTVEETAEVLGISAATVKRDWSLAKAWLRREMDGRRS